MKNVYVIVFSVIFLGLLSFTGCAKRGTITGGPKDTIAPKIVNSFPENYTTNFNGNEIKITFNELIKVKDINKQLIISPPLKKQPIIVPQGSASKFISIKILDSLQPNTTYSFNFGQSITDNNEGNPFSQLKYVFSTGKHIDSLAIMGKIKDAVAQKPDNFVSVQLYDAKTFSDSTVYKESPLYVTNTLDSLKVFALENLKEGDYYIVALKDANNNYKFDPKKDKIGFLKHKISIPNDTLFELELFKEEMPFKAIKPVQQTNNKLLMGFEGNPKGSKISITDNNQTVSLIMTKFPVKNKDSVQLFMPLLKADSVLVTVENKNYKKTFVTKLKEQKETDSLMINAVQKSTLHFRDSYTLTTSTPLKNIKKEFISLINKDSINVDFSLDYDEYEQEIKFDFIKKEEEKYQFTLLPNAIEDIYGTKNDSLLFKFATRMYSDYGNLKVNLVNVKRFPVILEVLNTKNEIVASTTSKAEKTLVFDALEPNIYRLRIIYDDNSNGIWDTGNYLEKRQAEEIQYYPKEIDVRANWDVEQEF